MSVTTYKTLKSAITAGVLCTRTTIIAQKNESIDNVAKLMRDEHVGSVVVVEKNGDIVKPVGILTDRDVVIEIVATDKNAKNVTVGEIMSKQPHTAMESQGIWETLNFMKEYGIRRMPIVNEQGSLIGILTIDDILDLLSEELGDMIKLMTREKKQEIKKFGGSKNP